MSARPATGGRRGWARLLLHPALSGAPPMIALFVAELAGSGGMAMMGVRDERIAGEVVSRHAAFLVAQQAAILGVYLVIALLVGLLAWAGLRLRDRPAAGVVGRLQIAGVVVGFELWRVAVTVVRYPQLYDAWLFARGGWRQGLQVLLTDHVPLLLLEAVGWIGLAALLVVPLLRRARRASIAAGARALISAARRRRGWALATLGALVAAALVRGFWPSPSAVDLRPSLLIIGVDSLRADRVGAGHEDVTPRLSALARRGVHFTRASVTVPRTFPSWTTILTGRWPQHHGIRTMFPSRAERCAVGPTLASRFASRGYATVVVSDFAGEIFSRSSYGFAERDVPYFDLRTISAIAGLGLHPGLYPYTATALGHLLAPSLEAAADNADPERLADRLIASLERSQGRPSLTVAFFSGAHFPYASPSPWYRRFALPGYGGRFRYLKPPPTDTQPDAALTDQDLAQIRRLYDGAVAATDAAIGRVLDALERSPAGRRTIVVLLADHGENLYEHGRGMGHGEHLRGPAALRIPLVVLDPVHAFPPHAVDAVVRDVDIAPTLAALLGERIDGDGADLGPLLRGERRDLGLAAFSETGLWFTRDVAGLEAGGRLPYPAVPDSLTLESGDDIVLDPELRGLTVVAKHRAIDDGRWKLVYQPTREGARWSLFDLAVDPEELRDVAAQHGDVVGALRGRLLDWSAIGGVREGEFVLPR